MAEPSPTGNQPPTDATYELDKLDPTALPSEMQPYYQSMLKDYRAKTEGIANERKQWEEQQKQQQAREAEMQQQLQTLQAFYQQATPLLHQYQAYLQQQQQQPQPGQQDDPYSQYMDDDAVKLLREEITKQREDFQQALAAQNQQIQQYVQQFTGVLSYQDQLRGLGAPHEQPIDQARVLEKAKELGTGNLTAAYELAYQPEILAAERDKAIAEARKQWEEELAARQIPPATPGGAMPAVPIRQVMQPLSDRDARRSGWNSAREAALKRVQSGQFE